ncbi:MAG: VTT domain-containing protein [Alphaproteobacteria bacterium]|nr:VTT domain-containing protein [Alphaproteobacteria bacterium]
MNEIIFNFLINLNEFISTYYIFSICVFFIISTLYFTFSLPGGMIILLSSGFFFGFIGGFFLNIISICLGSLIFIVFSKTLIKGLFEKYYIKFSDKLSTYIKSSSYEYLILIRLIIGPPLLFQNICISLLHISKTKILITSFIGFTPLMLLFSYLGSHVSNIIELKAFTIADIFTSEIIIIFVLIISILFFRIFIKK